jgi:hypothetical protein
MAGEEIGAKTADSIQHNVQMRARVALRAALNEIREGQILIEGAAKMATWAAALVELLSHRLYHRPCASTHILGIRIVTYD